MTATASELLITLRGALKNAEIPGYSLEARELLSAALGISPEELPGKMNLFLSKSTIEKAEDLLRRRINGEPCAYLIGEWDFYSLTFTVTPDVLIPRPETETLVERALELPRPICGDEPRILDLCCGSGCVGIALAHELPRAKTVLMDISPGALKVARENVRRHEQMGRTYICQADALAGWVSTYGRFDLIVSNPPYIRSGDFPSLDRSVRDFEPRLALDGGDDGLCFYRAIAEKWRMGLARGGKIAVECGYDQAEAVAALFRESGLHRVSISKDLFGVDRVVTGNIGESESRR